jgi:hypothetical protein
MAPSPTMFVCSPPAARNMKNVKSWFMWDSKTKWALELPRGTRIILKSDRGKPPVCFSSFAVVFYAVIVVVCVLICFIHCCLFYFCCCHY